MSILINKFMDAKLMDLGFSDKEAKVYKVLVKMGACAASTIARLVDVKRTSIYDVLNSLLKKGLITQFKQGTNTFYVVDDVDKIFFYQKEKLDLSKQLVKELKDKESYSEGIQVNYYRGVEGYREMYEHILLIKPDELLGWLHLDNFYKGLDPVREEQWTKERIKKKIYARLLMQETELTRNFRGVDKSSHRETRLISNEFPFSTTCFVYDEYVIFFDTEAGISGVRIHNPALAEMQRQIFEMNWKLYRK